MLKREGHLTAADAVQLEAGLQAAGLVLLRVRMAGRANDIDYTRDYQQDFANWEQYLAGYEAALAEEEADIYQDRLPAWDETRMELAAEGVRLTLTARRDPARRHGVAFDWHLAYREDTEEALIAGILRALQA